MTQIEIRTPVHGPFAAIGHGLAHAAMAVGQFFAAFDRAVAASAEAERLSGTSDRELAARGKTREQALRAIFERNFA